MNLNYKPENKDKDSSEILLEYIKNDYWFNQGHKSKKYILSYEIISEYFKKKDYKESSNFAAENPKAYHPLGFPLLCFYQKNRKSAAFEI